MTSLRWLAWTAIMTGLFWMPYVLNRLVAVGLPKSLGGTAIPNELHAEWAQRAKAAHANAVENLVVFATLVLVAEGVGLSGDETVLMWTAVFFYARLAHYVVYTLKLPVIRTLAFFAGFVAQVGVAVAILF